MMLNTLLNFIASPADVHGPFKGHMFPGRCQFHCLGNAILADLPNPLLKALSFIRSPKYLKSSARSSDV